MVTPDKSAVPPYELSPVIAHTADGGVMLNNSLIGMRTKDTEKNESTLEMTLDLNDPKAAELFPEMDITFRNRVYRIRSLDFTGNTRSGDSRIEVYAERSWYELLYSGKLATVEFSRASIRECLEYVLRDTAWTVGRVDASDKATWKLSEGTALSGINQIGSTYGLQPVFDEHAKKVLLLSNPGRDRGTTFTYDKHVTKSTRRIDTTGLITRIYGQSPDGVTISKVNGGKPYLEDYSYSKELRIAYYDFKEGIKAAEMKRLMEAYLFMRAKPVISYEFELSGLSGRQHEIERFDVFDTVFIMDKDYPSSVRSKVVSLDIDWINLDKSQIGLGTELVSLARVADPSNGNAPGRISTKEMPPERMPATPVEVAASSTGYWDGETPLSTITVTWPKVSTSQSGKNMAIDSYEVLLSTGELISTEDNTATFEGLMVNTPTEVKVRALVEGVSGYWSVPTKIHTETPDEPLPAPYGITATADASIVQVRWSGNLLQGGVAVKAPARTEKVIVEQSPDTVNDWHIVGSIVHGETTLILPFKPEDVGSTYRYRMRAVDRVDVYSPYSDTASVTIKDDFSVKLEEDLKASKDRLAEAEKQATKNLETLTEKLDNLKFEIGTSDDEGLRAELQKAKEDVEQALFDINDPSGKLAQAAADAQKSLNQLNDKLYGKEGSLSKLSEKAQQAWNKAVAVGDKNVVEITYEYQAGSSYTKAPTGAWVADQPAVSAGDYLWRREKHIFGNGDVTIKEPYPVTGPQGADGKSGKDGKVGSAGKDGTGVASTTVTYQVGSSGTEKPTGGWLYEVPAAKAGDYVWTRVVWQYTDGTSKTSYSVAKIGETGARGATGARGSRGVSLVSVTPYFSLATKTPKKPTSADPEGWQKTEPGYRSGYNLYRSDKVEFSTGTFSWTDVTLVTSYQVAVKALESANGKNTINTSTATSPTKNGTTAGDVWWRVDGKGNVIAQWTWDGSSWKSNKIESDVIASLDVNKLSVATSAKMNEAVIDKLWADGLSAKTITASRLTVSPGNMFPDPNFEDPSWNVSTEGVGTGPGYLTLVANGKQHGAYLQPEGQRDASMRHTPGTNYLLTAHIRFGGNSDISKFSVYVRYKNDGGVVVVSKVGTFVRYPSDQDDASYRYKDNSIVLNFSHLDMAPGGYFTLGFFVESSESYGSVVIKDIRLTPMAGTTLIEDGAITTDKVKANAITAKQLAANSVTADALKADAVKADHLLADDATIDKLWTNGLAAKSIVSESLVISSTNLLPSIANSANNPLLIKEGPYKNFKIRADTISQTGAGSDTPVLQTISLEKGEQYRLSLEARADVAGASFFAFFKDVSNNANYSVEKGAISTDFPMFNIKVTTSWAPYTVEFTSPKDVEVQLYLNMNHGQGATNTKDMSMRSLHLMKMTGGVLIKDGAIDTNKLAANAVTAGKIDAGAVEAKHIKSGQITSDHIKAGTIKADRVEAKVFTQIGTSVLPLSPGKTKPAWTDSAEGTYVYNGETYYTFSSTRGPVHDNYSAVNDDMEYEFTITLYSPQRCVLFVELRDDNNNHAVLSGGLNNPDYVESPDSNGVVRQTDRNYLVSNFKVYGAITTYKSVVKLRPGTKFVRIANIYGAHPNGPAGTVYIKDMDLVPHQVSQKTIDSMQDKQIQDNQARIKDIEYMRTKVVFMHRNAGIKSISTPWVLLSWHVGSSAPDGKFVVRVAKGWKGYVEADVRIKEQSLVRMMWADGSGKLNESNGMDADGSPAFTGNSSTDSHNFEGWDYIICRVYPVL